MEMDESPLIYRLSRVLYTMDAEIFHVYSTLLEVNGEFPIGSEDFYGLFDVEGNLDLPGLADLKRVMLSKDVEHKLRLLSFWLDCEEDACPEELEGVIGGSLDGSRTLNNHLVCTSEILALLEVLVSLWLAVSG